MRIKNTKAMLQQVNNSAIYNLATNDLVVSLYKDHYCRFSIPLKDIRLGAAKIQKMAKSEEDASAIWADLVLAYDAEASFSTKTASKALKDLFSDGMTDSWIELGLNTVDSLPPEITGTAA